MEELKEWCHLIPKIELHAHLNGSIRDSTLLSTSVISQDITEVAKVSIPPTRHEESAEVRMRVKIELAKVLGEKGVIVFAAVEDVIMKSGRSLPECFQLFDLFHILATDHETVARIAKEAIEDFAAENVVYIELRTTPKNNESKGMTKRSYMEAVIKGLRSIETVSVYFLNTDDSTDNSIEAIPINDIHGAKKKNIYVRLLLSIDRRETTAAAMETVDLALELKDLGVVGIDLSGNPVVGEWNTFLPALTYAKEQGLPITLHCGEVPNRKEVQSMLDICPQRIGHACFLENEEWERVKSSKIPVEICLTSNLRTQRLESIDRHHFADLYKAKHPMVLCTDDPGLFSTSVSNEYYLAAATFGLNKGELIDLAQNAIEFVFASDGVKKALTDIIQAAKRELQQ